VGEPGDATVGRYHAFSGLALDGAGLDVGQARAVKAAGSTTSQIIVFETCAGALVLVCHALADRSGLAASQVTSRGQIHSRRHINGFVRWRVQLGIRLRAAVRQVGVVASTAP
jgi:hypothetical protein